MDLATPIATALTLGSTALGLSGLALASALLATTPACELLTEQEASEATGQKMEQQGGTGDIPYLSGCYWDAQDGGGRLEFSLSEAGLFSPSGQTAQDHYKTIVKTLSSTGEAFEEISGVGHSAVLMERDEGVYIAMAAGEGYLSIRLSGGKRDAIIAIAKIAAGKM